MIESVGAQSNANGVSRPGRGGAVLAVRSHFSGPFSSVCAVQQARERMRRSVFTDGPILFACLLLVLLATRIDAGTHLDAHVEHVADVEAEAVWGVSNFGDSERSGQGSLVGPRVPTGSGAAATATGIASGSITAIGTGSGSGSVAATGTGAATGSNKSATDPADAHLLNVSWRFDVGAAIYPSTFYYGAIDADAFVYYLRYGAVRSCRWPGGRNHTAATKQYSGRL